MHTVCFSQGHLPRLTSTAALHTEPLLSLLIRLARRFSSSPLVHCGRRPTAATAAKIYASRTTGHTPFTPHRQQELVTVRNDDRCYFLPPDDHLLLREERRHTP